MKAQSKKGGFNPISKVAGTVGNVVGGGIGKVQGLIKKKDFLIQENQTKIILNSEDSHDKWFVKDNPTPWITLEFKKPISIRAYGLKSANDFPSRNPKVWKLTAVIKDHPEPVLIHEVKREVFNSFWQQKIFLLNEEFVVQSVTLEVLENAGDENF